MFSLLIMMFAFPLILVTVFVLQFRQFISPEGFAQRKYKTLHQYQLQISRLSSELNNPKTDIRKKLNCAQEIVDGYSRLQSFCSQSRGGVEWFRNTCIFPSSQAKEAVSDYTTLLSELQVFHTDFFPTVSPDQKIQSDWNVLSCDHDSYEQLIRQKRSIRTFPVYIDHKMRNGFFLSHDMNSIYSVSLFDCTCPDHESRVLPCKHMYRLFYELTVGTDYSLDINVTDLYEATGFIELSDSDKVSYINIVRSLYNRGNLPWTTHKSSCVNKSLELGLLLQSDAVDYISLLNHHTKDKIITSIRKFGITDCYPSWTKTRIIDYIIEHHEQYLKKEYADFVAVVIPPALERWCSGITSVVNSEFLQEWDHRFEKFL
ncbi:hypothetical protein D1159_00365 [Pseudoflavonifractor sp. 524-17]|uniref:hypothetical protein n=1 Tax=Pseudoflavonifractor sp. 524-17 TaxID=2304577 RepID=UPI00137A693B|nr:hypothetical protein [Pseudoflavonifractor sp. 524-17]NCE63065.1 hypothetical protein [Pseudoflavonifractor sp. 524-17]